MDEISPEALVVDYYDTKTKRNYFRDYYYHEGVFYYDTDMDYRILNVIVNKHVIHADGRSRVSTLTLWRLGLQAFI